MPTRRQARQVAVQVLYQDDLNPGCNPAVADEMIAQQLRDPELVEFARELVAGVRRNRPMLDERIGGVAAHWTLDRMAATDRAVLRLGSFEILLSETPDTVAIDEAIELARFFGTAQSASFVNGLLDRLIQQKQT